MPNTTDAVVSGKARIATVTGGCVVGIVGSVRFLAETA
jgi:hypothetical protein